MFALRQAFQRRSLAFDVGHLCGFEAYETWINKLFEAAQRAVPKGYAQVTLGQLVVADRELFVRLADRLEGQLQKPIGADRELFVRLADRLEGQLQKPIGAEKPMDAALRELSDSHDINQFLQPLAGPPPPPHPNKRPLKDPPLDTFRLYC
eukprot:s12762_g1.t1